jgi:hypothetical protein
LSIARAKVVDTAIEMKEAHNHIFDSTAFILAANDDIKVLRWLCCRHDCQEAMERNTLDISDKIE